MAVTAVNTILAGIETRLAAVLTTFTQLSHVLNISRQSFANDNDYYGVYPSAAVEVEGVHTAYTVRQTFNVVLTRGYITSAQGDSGIVTIIEDLYDSMHDVFVDLHKQKAGAPSVVMVVNNRSIEDHEVLEDQKIVVLRGSIDILYRVSLL